MESHYDDILSDSPSGSFSELQTLINDNYNGEVTLDKDYVFDETSDEEYKTDGVIINKKITINGDNHVINADGARIFKITGSFVTLNNITFKNAANNAIFVSEVASNVTVNNSCFSNNSVTNSHGGAIYWDGHNGTLANSVFAKNHLTCTSKNEGNFDGGAVYWGGHNGTLTGSKFIENYAKRDPSSSSYAYVEGGAIYWNGDNGTVSNSVFNKNHVDARDLSGEYEKMHSGSGGGIYWNGKNATLTNTNFTNNKASRHAGGAYMNNNTVLVKNCNFINNTASMEAGALKIHRANSTVENCNFTDNTLTGNEIDIEHTVTIGGAIYVSRGINNILIKDSYFRGNNATNGSAIYLNTASKLEIVNTVFLYNQAKSRLLDIKQNKRNFTTTFYANDNINNVIWDNNNLNDDSYIKIDGTVPKQGVEHSKNGQLLYQDDREFNQEIIVNILDESDNVLYTTTLTTGLYGDVNFTTYNGKKLQFIHLNDVYYTEIINATDIPEITIIGEDKICYVNDEVTVAISLKDVFGDNITNGTVKVQFNNGEVHEFDAADFAHEITLTAPAQIGEYDLNLTYTDPYGIIIKNSSKVIVKPIILTVNKTADDVDVLTNNSVVNFTITVNNTSIFDVSDVIVVDELPEGLTFEDAGFITDGENNNWIKLSNGAQWTVSTLKSNAIFKLWITARTNGAVMGNITNKVRVNCSRNTTQVFNETNITVVPVVLTVNKTADVKTVGNNSEVTFTIKINSTGCTAARNVIVVDELPEGFVYVDSTLSGNGIKFDTSDNRTLTWTVAELSEPVELFVTVTTASLGNLTNNVTVTSYENKTQVKDNATVNAVPAELTVVKSADVDNVSVGDLVKFTIEVTNDGLIDTTDVTVTDVVNTKAFEIREIGNQPYVDYNDTEKIVWVIPSLNKGNSTRVYVTVKVLAEGKYNNTAVVKSSKSDKTESTVNITVNKIPVHITVGNITTYPSREITIPVNVSSDDNVPFNGNVTIILPDGSNSTVLIINGTGSTLWNVPDDCTPDVYNDTVKFPGDNVYLESGGNGTVTVLPVPTQTAIGNVTGKAGQNVTVPVNVTCDDKKPFNGNVTVSLPDGTNKTVKITDGKGSVIWTIPEDYGGNYTDNASYPGNKTYLPSNGTGIITVIPKIPTHISVDNITVYHGDNVTLPVNVTADDGTAFNGNVTVTLPDGTNQTVEITEGTGNIKWTVPENFPADSYDVPATFEGNESYLPSNGTGIIKVISKIPTYISVGNVSGNPGDNVTVPITVTADDENPFNGNVTVTLPDDTVKPVEIVDGEGNVTWMIPETYTLDDYPVAVRFDGGNGYLPSNGTGFITVNEKIPTHVTIANVTGSPGDNVTIPIIVTADDNKTFTGTVIVIFPDGSNQTVEISNGEGKVSWVIPENSDDINNISVKFSGNDRYLPSSGPGVVSVVHVDVELSISADSSNVNYGDAVEFTITVRNNGPGNATDVTVQNVIPEGFAYISDSLSGTGYQTAKDKLMASASSPSYDASSNVWYIGDLTNGGEAKLSILAYANYVGTKKVSSSVSITEKETDYTNNNATADVTVNAIADLKLVKRVDKTKIKTGDEVTYTFTVTNMGPCDATCVKVTDIGLTRFEFVEASSDDYDPETGVWAVGNLTNGSSVSLTVTVKINEIGDYPNTAGVSANENDSDMSNNNASSEVVSVSQPAEPQKNSETQANATADNVSPQTEVPILPETGNPIFIAVFVLLTAILLPLRRRE